MVQSQLYRYEIDIYIMHIMVTNLNWIIDGHIYEVNKQTNKQNFLFFARYSIQFLIVSLRHRLSDTGVFVVLVCIIIIFIFIVIIIIASICSSSGCSS